LKEIVDRKYLTFLICHTATIIDNPVGELSKPDES